MSLNLLNIQRFVELFSVADERMLRAKRPAFGFSTNQSEFFITLIERVGYGWYETIVLRP